MRALFIGGTGTISSAVTALLAKNSTWELFLLNRGSSKEKLPDGVKHIIADINDENAVAEKLEGIEFDTVVDFIAFTPQQIERDIRLFQKKTGQYIFISSASAYQKPLSNYLITESTPLSNPYWQYSRDKIACEERLMKEYRTNGFPVTIVRPSSTYGDRSVPVAVHGSQGTWQVIDRMRKGKPVILFGDGSSLWTFTHNTDFAKGFIGLMGNMHAIGEAVHITSDESVTWNQAYKTIAHALGVQARIIHMATDFLVACRPELEGGLIGDKCNSVVFDNSKIKRLVPAFQASVRFDQGVRRTIDYVLSHPELQKTDAEFDRWCDDMILANAAGLTSFLEQHALPCTE